jgi:hypothetical protein
MDNKNDIHENGSDSKLIEQFGTASPFEVPEGYFESFPEKVLDQVREEKGRRIRFQPWVRNLAAAAAILVLAVLATTYLLRENETIDESLPDISMSDLYMYSVSSLADLEETYLMTLIDHDSLDMQLLTEPDTSELSDEFIQEYLLAENHIEYLILTEY